MMFDVWCLVLNLVNTFNKVPLTWIFQKFPYDKDKKIDDNFHDFMKDVKLKLLPKKDMKNWICILKELLILIRLIVQLYCILKKS